MSQEQKEFDSITKALKYREAALHFVDIQLKCLKSASMFVTSGLERMLRLKNTLIAYREAGIITSPEADAYMARAYQNIEKDPHNPGAMTSINTPSPSAN